MGQAGRQHLLPGKPRPGSPTSLFLSHLLSQGEPPESWQLVGAPWAGSQSCHFSFSSHQSGSSRLWGAQGEAAASLELRTR